MLKIDTYSVTEALRDGCQVEIRALRPEDRADLLAAVNRTSAQSLYRRFFGLKRNYVADAIRCVCYIIPELSLHRRVPIGADRDPSHLVFSPAISVGSGSFGWGPASVLINTLFFCVVLARLEAQQIFG